MTSGPSTDNGHEPLHVILDGLSMLEQFIETGHIHPHERTPWLGYTGAFGEDDEHDPTQGRYMEAIEAARAIVTNHLNDGTDLT